MLIVEISINSFDKHNERLDIPIQGRVSGFNSNTILKIIVE